MSDVGTDPGGPDSDGPVGLHNAPEMHRHHNVRATYGGGRLKLHCITFSEPSAPTFSDKILVGSLRAARMIAWMKDW